MTDPIADFLTRLRNAARASQTDVIAPYSKIKAEIARILKQEGYITNYEVDTDGQVPADQGDDEECITGPSAITGLKRVSQPGLRTYVGAGEIPRVLGGMGISILSTPQGIITGREAKKQNVGGELLAYVW